MQSSEPIRGILHSIGASCPIWAAAFDHNPYRSGAEGQRRGCARGGSVLKSSVFIVKRSERPDSFQSGVTVIQFSKIKGLFDHGRGGGDCASLREVRAVALDGPGW